MRLTLASWNINSVRLRIGQVARFCESAQPDILCLQETKCPDDRFPLKDLYKLGYPHILFKGQKGYHGVAILSKLPLERLDHPMFGGKDEARSISARIAKGGGSSAGIILHNFYVPAGGDIPDPDINAKFAHKLSFLDDLKHWGLNARPSSEPAILVGDLNIAPLEHDVWSHKQLLDVVSHTPIETEALELFRQDTGWSDAIRDLTPEPEKLYTWWSYRSPDWAGANKGRRLDHIWLSPKLRPALQASSIARETRSWERPSDHVPVMVTLEV